jgi:hypothetical protein
MPSGFWGSWLAALVAFPCFRRFTINEENDAGSPINVIVCAVRLKMRSTMAGSITSQPTAGQKALQNIFGA